VTRVLVLVEGQTEERFVKNVLYEKLMARSVFLVPKLVTTMRTKQGPDFKGGVSKYSKVEKDLQRLLGDSDAAAVTTFIDYYGLPEDFPGMDSRPSRASPMDRARHVEASWQARIGHPRFHPYLMVHEFEALLFTRPEEICIATNQHNARGDLQAIRDAFGTPEEIDDDPRTAPSKRIEQRLPGYRKTLHGPMVARRIGLELLRQECAHFGEWIDWLEAL
jgi:hypothetical protein